jgi:phospholipid/cholesterol/gamma-HCH transport system substrate-binding protein
METRANYALIGAFVILIAGAVLGFVLWLGSSSLNRDFAAYDIIFAGPVTLEEGSAVRYIGIKVGEVETVRIDRRDASKVRARIRIDRSTPVKTDSTASIEFAGITGVTFVQINAGSERAGPLLVQAGQDVALLEAEPNPLANLFADGAEIAGRASMTLEQATALISDENIASISSILKNADSVLATVVEGDEDLLAQVGSTLASLERASEELSNAARATTSVGEQAELRLAEVTSELTLLLGDLRQATGVAEASFVEGKDALTSARALIEGPTTQALTDAQLTAQDLRTLVSRLDRVVRDLEQNPQEIVVGKPLPYEKKR